ncbi:hypothetical protein [Paenibacillus fonticola]|uniref:hypothetical protein n=1 Tax=Paenibacillus fonticola TaxID=379896 RepID=UPI00035E4C38|nr:hypothetical protein [Paenibacillus fonticola]
MKRLVSVTLLLLILVTGLVSFPVKKVFACSCVGGDAKEKLERSAVVFVGKVIKKGGTQNSQYGRLREYTFDVDRAWKGINDKDSRITIYSYDGGSESCGFQFDKNQTYLVYSYLAEDNSLQTNLCSGNIPISQAGDELKQLGTGTILSKNNVEETNHETNHDQNLSLIIILSIGVSIIIALVVLFIWRSKKRDRIS